jgi:hypothetical protein
MFPDISMTEICHNSFYFHSFIFKNEYFCLLALLVVSYSVCNSSLVFACSSTRERVGDDKIKLFVCGWQHYVDIHLQNEYNKIKGQQKIIAGKHRCKKTMKYQNIVKGNEFLRYE